MDDSKTNQTKNPTSFPGSSEASNPFGRPGELPSTVTVYKGMFYDSYQIGTWHHYCEPGRLQSILTQLGYVQVEKNDNKQTWEKK